MRWNIGSQFQFSFLIHPCQKQADTGSIDSGVTLPQLSVKNHSGRKLISSKGKHKMQMYCIGILEPILMPLQCIGWRIKRGNYVLKIRQGLNEEV